MFIVDDIIPAMESLNEEDIARINVPTLIRLFEYIREDVKSDIPIHTMTEKIIEICNNENRHVTMDDYESIIGQSEHSEPDGDEALEGLKNKTHSTVVIVMEDIDTANALTDALNKFKKKASVGGDVEMLIDVGDSVTSCGIIGHDVQMGNIYHNIPDKDDKDKDD